MIKILGSLLLLLFLSTVIKAGSLKASVDATTVQRGDTVLLSLTVVAEKSERLPDIDEIEGVKVSVRRHQGYTFVQINGENKMEHTQTMTLEFKPFKSMTIPSFKVEVDGELKSTSPILLTVVDTVAGTKRESEYFSLEMKLNGAKFFLGEPIVATVYFKQKTAVEIMRLEYDKPQFKAFFTKQFGKEKQYKKEGYTIHELNYLLMPKEEGNLTVESVQARVAQRVRQQQAGGWFADVPKWSNITSSSFNVEVVKPKGVYTLVGDFVLKEHLETINAQVNKPIHLEIEIEGEGSLEDFNGIDYDIEGITIYSDDAKTKRQWMKNHLESHYLKEFVFIANHNFRIPSKELAVFNPKIGKIQILKTKAYVITIEGAREAGDKSAIETKKSLNLNANMDLEKDVKLNLSYGVLILTFFLGTFFTLLFQYLFRGFKTQWRRKKIGFDGDEALRVLYPNIGQSKEVEAMVRKLYALKNGEKDVKIDKEVLKKHG